MKYQFAAALLSSALLLGGCASAGADKAMDKSMDKPAMEMSTEDKSMEKDAMEKDAMEKDSMEKDAMEHKAGLTSYETYETMSKEELMGKRVVLFFNASWCPTCRSIVQGLEKDSSWIDDKLLLVDVDYDSHDDLKKKYGVTMQTTFVEVDEEGMKKDMFVASSVDDLKMKLGL